MKVASVFCFVLFVNIYFNVSVDVSENNIKTCRIQIGKSCNKNGQSTDTGNIGYTRHRTMTINRHW